MLYLTRMPIYKEMKNWKPFCLVLVLWMSFTSPAFADAGLIAQGLVKTFYALFQIPANMIEGGAQSFPIGIVTGALTGSMKMVVGTVMGVADIAQGAAPYAKYAALAFV